jgi:hypothetical protein
MYGAYFRIQSRHHGRTGKPVGIFGSCHHLVRNGAFTPEECATFAAIDAWFTEHLPEPPFYQLGNPDNAITWFKHGRVDHFLERLTPLLALLRKRAMPFDTIFTDFPGEIIYEDPYQIATR